MVSAANLVQEQQSTQHLTRACWPFWLFSYLCVVRHFSRRFKSPVFAMLYFHNFFIEV